MKTIPGDRTPRGDVSHRLFFFGETNRAYGVHHAYAPVEKVECRVEDGGFGWSCIDFGDPLRMEDGSYRCYGTARTPDQGFMGVGLWESKDALHWSPVYLGQVKRDGKDTNLIQFENLPGDQSSVGLPNVVPTRDGPLRMYFWKHRDGHLRYLIAESDDGLKWRVLDIEKPALFHPHDGGLWELAEGLTPEKAVKVVLPKDRLQESVITHSVGGTQVLGALRDSELSRTWSALEPHDYVASIERLIEQQYSQYRNEDLVSGATVLRDRQSMRDYWAPVSPSVRVHEHRAIAERRDTQLQPFSAVAAQPALKTHIFPGDAGHVFDTIHTRNRIYLWRVVYNIAFRWLDLG